LRVSPIGIGVHAPALVHGSRRRGEISVAPGSFSGAHAEAMERLRQPTGGPQVSGPAERTPEPLADPWRALVTAADSLPGSYAVLLASARAGASYQEIITMQV